MSKKFLFILIVMLPLLPFSQERRTLIIGNDHHRGMFYNLYKPVRSSLQFVSRLFDKQEKLVRRLKNKILCNSDQDRFAWMAYRPFYFNNGDMIVVPRPSISDRNIIIKKPGEIIIQRKVGPVIRITRDRRI